MNNSSYTSHGHLIPGAPAAQFPPDYKARCGGLAFCQKCKTEADLYSIRKVADKIANPKRVTVDEQTSEFVD